MKVFAVVLLGLRVIIGTDLPHLYQKSIDATVLEACGNDQSTRSSSADSMHKSSSCNGRGSIADQGNHQALTFVRLAGCGNVCIERMMSVPAPGREHCSVIHQIWQMAWFQEKHDHRLHLETRLVADNSLRRSVVRRL